MSKSSTDRVRRFRARKQAMRESNGSTESNQSIVDAVVKLGVGESSLPMRDFVMAVYESMKGTSFDGVTEDALRGRVSDLLNAIVWRLKGQ